MGDSVLRIKISSTHTSTELHQNIILSHFYVHDSECGSVWDDAMEAARWIMVDMLNRDSNGDDCE